MEAIAFKRYLIRVWVLIFLTITVCLIAQDRPAKTTKEQWQDLIKHPLIGELAPIIEAEIKQESPRNAETFAEYLMLLRDTLIHLLARPSNGSAALAYFNHTHEVNLETIDPRTNSRILRLVADTIADHNVHI